MADKDDADANLPPLRPLGSTRTRSVSCSTNISVTKGTVTGVKYWFDREKREALFVAGGPIEKLLVGRYGSDAEAEHAGNRR
jgi:hypothetical protein